MILPLMANLPPSSSLTLSLFIRVQLAARFWGVSRFTKRIYKAAAVENTGYRLANRDYYAFVHYIIASHFCAVHIYKPKSVWVIFVWMRWVRRGNWMDSGMEVFLFSFFLFPGHYTTLYYICVAVHVLSLCWH